MPCVFVLQDFPIKVAWDPSMRIVTGISQLPKAAVATRIK